MKKSTLFLTRAAIIAALYVVLTELSALIGLSSGIIQFRLSEALCILPIFTAAAIPGLAVGCVLANLLTGAVVWDVIFGSLATLLGALGAYALRRFKYLAPVPTIIANALIVPFVLRYAYSLEGTIPFFMLTVGIGEVVTCGGLGTVLTAALSRRAGKLFK
jgi:uncharacterized membrane protein